MFGRLANGRLSTSRNVSISCNFGTIYSIINIDFSQVSEICSEGNEADAAKLILYTLRNCEKLKEARVEQGTLHDRVMVALQQGDYCSAVKAIFSTIRTWDGGQYCN